MEWKKVPISSICEGIYEGPHATPPSCESGAYYLGIPALTSDGQIDFSKVPRICEKDFKKWTKRVTPKYGDIVFTNEATLNLYARIPKDFYGCLGRRLGLVRPLQDKVDVDYLFYYFFSPYWRKVIALKKVSGSTVERILMKKFPHFPVLLPPLNIQNKIASILSDYDNLIENNNKRIRLLEQMAENLYKEWFVRFRFPGHEKAEFENGLPKGWKIEKIGNVSETIGGGTPSTENPAYWDGDIKWVTPSDITSKNSLPLLKVEGRISEEGLKKSSAKLLPPYTILMTSRASIGYFGIAPFEVCTNQGFISIIPQKENLRMFMLYMLKSRKDEIIANANGATFLEISKGRFRKMNMVVPIDSVLDSFENKARTIFEEIMKIEQQNQILSRQRDLLLPRLMSGKLEVKV